MQSLHLSRRSLLAATAAGTAFAFSDLAYAASPSGALTVGIDGDLITLDPGNANDTLSQSAARLMMEGLIGFNHRMKEIPLLAESYEASADAKEFTFHLRHGVAFHDGTPFDAAAVKFNFERVANPANHLKRQSLLSMLDHVEVVDTYTAKCVLKTPFGAFVPTVAHPSLQFLSPAAVKKYGADIGRHPVGTGPFRFVSWTPDTLKVAANSTYWQKGMPHVKAITVRSNPGAGPRIAMLQAGEAQFINPVPPPMVDLVKKNPKLALLDYPSIYPCFVTMNTRKKPYGDVRVRRALNYAIDKSAFIKVVYQGYAKPLLSAEPPEVTFYEEQPEYKYDPGKAKALLAAAGLGSGFSTKLWGGNDSTTIQAMQFLQQQLGAVGVKVAVEPLEIGVYYSRIFMPPDESKLELSYGRWSSSTGDADWALRPLFWGKAFPPRLANAGFYENAEVDKDLEGALETADPTKRKAFYADAQKRIYADAPWIFLATPSILAGYDRNLKDAWILPDNGLLIDRARFV